MGYRRLKDELDRRHNTHVNDKRMLRICRSRRIKSDVTEFKYYVGIEVKKVYLSAILDLYDRRIVSYVIRDTNDNPLVFDTFRAAIKANPDAHPLSHSDYAEEKTIPKICSAA